MQCAFSGLVPSEKYCAWRSANATHCAANFGAGRICCSRCSSDISWIVSRMDERTFSTAARVRTIVAGNSRARSRIPCTVREYDSSLGAIFRRILKKFAKVLQNLQKRTLKHRSSHAARQVQIQRTRRFDVEFEKFRPPGKRRGDQRVVDRVRSAAAAAAVLLRGPGRVVISLLLRRRRHRLGSFNACARVPSVFILFLTYRDASNNGNLFDNDVIYCCHAARIENSKSSERERNRIFSSSLRPRPIESKSPEKKI